MSLYRKYTDRPFRSVLGKVVMVYALFLILLGLLEKIYPGLMASSWYCIVIAALAVALVLGIGFSKHNRLGCACILFFTIYAFFISMLYRISAEIVIGSWVNILIFSALTVFIIAFLASTFFRPL